MDWTGSLVEQLDMHWTGHLRPRLDGLTDHEYLWEPVPECWNVRPRGTSSAPVQGGSGDFTVDFGPEPNPAPVTTIAWRMAHLIVGVFGARVATHFGGPPMDYMNFAYAGTADAALAQLDENYKGWIEGVRGMSSERLTEPCGEPGYEQFPYAALVLHISRETIHHGAEICLLRDLYIRLGYR